MRRLLEALRRNAVRRLPAHDGPGQRGRRDGAGLVCSLAAAGESASGSPRWPSHGGSSPRSVGCGSAVGLPSTRRSQAPRRRPFDTSLPEIRPAALIVNRLWPLFLFALASAALGLLDPRFPVSPPDLRSSGRCRGATRTGSRGDRGARRRHVLHPADLAVRGMSLLRAPGFRSSRGENIRRAVG